MARVDLASQLGLPSHAGDDGGERRGAPDADRPRLRLVVTRGHLGVELEQPWVLGPLVVQELSLSYPRVRFPVDLSGGVPSFRNRRGRLEHVVLEAEAGAARRFAAPRLRGVLSESTPACMVAPVEDGWLVGLSDEQRALCFDVLLAPLDGDLRLMAVHARGLGLGAPAQVLAAQALHQLVRPHGTLVGGVVVIGGAATKIARHLLPLAGMRAAEGRELRWHPVVAADLQGLRLCASRQEAPAPVSAAVTRAMELAVLAGEADAAALRGDLDAARHAYLHALSAAPRHDGIARRLADLDRCLGDRAEAALGLLSEAVAPVAAGPLGGSLLAAAGDRAGAHAAFLQAAAAEPYGPLAALCLLRAEALAADPRAALAALDEAVVRAPALTLPRWRRFEQRLARGEMALALADVQHLEAAADGGHGRYEVLARAAGALRLSRRDHQAAELYERALRYRPAGVDAVAGLAGALADLGHRERALELLVRASAIAARAGEPAYAVELDLAEALADTADDLPAAIARARRVPNDEPWTFRARLLEARWRARLGDLAGASVVLGQLRAAVEPALEALTSRRAPDEPRAPVWGERTPWPTQRDACAALAAMLAEGADVEEHQRRDLPAARRLVGLALRLQPGRAALRGRFAALCTALGDPA